MILTLTLWQKKASGFPSRAGQGRFEDPDRETFAAGIARLLATVEPNARPFQLVAQVGDSSRSLQLGGDDEPEWVVDELWKAYRALLGVNG
jgi:hypothetical protein